MSDTLLAENYLQWIHNISKHVNETNDSSVQNDIFQDCILTSNDTIDYTYICSEFQDPWFGILTLVFIYLPSIQVISALYGPRLSRQLGFWLGLCMATVGIIIAGIDLYYNNAEMFVIGVFLGILGFGTILISLTLVSATYKTWFPICSKDNDLKALSYPILVVFSPLVLIMMKILQLIRNTELIQNMVKVASEGEVLFESAPQLTLQLYVVLSKLNPDGWTWFSITTSILSLLISFVHSQYIENLPEESEKKYVKSAMVMLPNIIFRILSLRYNEF